MSHELATLPPQLQEKLAQFGQAIVSKLRKIAVDTFEVAELTYDAYLVWSSNSYANVHTPTSSDQHTRFGLWWESVTNRSARAAYNYLAFHRAVTSKQLKDIPRPKLAAIDDCCFYELGKTDVQPELLTAVAEAIVKNEKIHVKDIRSMRDKLKKEQRHDKEDGIPEGDSVTVEAQEAKGAKTTSGPTDFVGHLLPDSLVGVFEKCREIQAEARPIGHLIKLFMRLEAEPAAVAIDCKQVWVDLQNARDNIGAGLPYSVCPSCKGKGCMRPTPKRVNCDQRGWITKSQWSGTVESQRR